MKKILFGTKIQKIKGKLDFTKSIKKTVKKMKNFKDFKMDQ